MEAVAAPTVERSASRTTAYLAGDLPEHGQLTLEAHAPNECSDAAYQGLLHIRDEIARNPRGSHSWAASMTDDEITDYLDSFVSGGGGQRLDDGSVGWYDPGRGVAVIQRSEYSMTGYQMPYSDFLGRLAD